MAQTAEIGSDLRKFESASKDAFLQTAHCNAGKRALRSSGVESGRMKHGPHKCANHPDRKLANYPSEIYRCSPALLDGHYLANDRGRVGMDDAQGTAVGALLCHPLTGLMIEAIRMIS